MRSLLLVVLLAVVCHASSQGTTTSAGTRANSQDQPSVVTTEDPSQTDSDTLINASSWPQILQDLSNVLSSPSGSLSECSRARLPAGSMEWNDGIGESSLTVEWGYGNETCSSMDSCYGVTFVEGQDVTLDPQLLPLQIQPGIHIKFAASKRDVPFKMQPYKVGKDGFQACDVTEGIPLIENYTSDVIMVDPKLIELGNNYFIARTSDNMYKCELGLRLNITMKSKDCTPPGEENICNKQGRCVTSPLQSAYTCDCCEGHMGRYCELTDPCSSQPCHNAGECIPEVDGTGFYCQCQTGYVGEVCEHHMESLCDINPCDNNATCVGNATHWHCACPTGYEGHHCEVNINDCASNPCLHGVCVDHVNAHQCFCTPGYGGRHCDIEYDECQSIKCHNGGYCVNMDGDHKCHCERGYTGPHCSVKVDLCHPSPCKSATHCVDLGHNLTCICSTGFTGAHCEININECLSSPCMYNGLCRDRVAGYSCLCPLGHTGSRCQYVVEQLPRRPLGGVSSMDTPWRRRSHLVNLYIVAGTLAGALMIAMGVLAGCYCRIYHTYRNILPCCCCWARRGYARHKDESLKSRIDSSSLAGSRPTLDAILEASSPSYHGNSLNAPLVHSLKPKRV